MRNLPGEDEALLILGSLFWNTFSDEDNRYHDRSEIHPVQAVFGSDIGPDVVRVPFFDSEGELGVSSMAALPDGRVWFTTGTDLVEVCPATRPTVTRFEIPGLRDVHEITRIDDVLWLANTGCEEAVAFDVRKRSLARGIPLDPFRLKAGVLASRRGDRDRFHCNQVFRGLDGRLYALVHQVTGRRLGRRLARGLLRKQGDGGILDLETGARIHLWLSAPHTVTVVGQEYWVFDSGCRRIHIYDAEWRIQARIPVPSFGRGGDVSPGSGLFFAGISQWRLDRAARDAARQRGEPDARNLIQVFEPGSRRCVGEIEVPGGLEQINNVYVVPRALADALIGLS